MPITWNLKQWLRTKHGLKNAKDIRDLIEHRTGLKVPLRRVRTLLNGQPKSLDIEITQAICTAFKCELKHFCDVTPHSGLHKTPHSGLNKTPVKIHALLQPCAIAPHESLRWFILRVQVAAITKAESMTDNFTQAARLLVRPRLAQPAHLALDAVDVGVWLPACRRRLGRQPRAVVLGDDGFVASSQGADGARRNVAAFPHRSVAAKIRRKRHV